MTPNPDSTPHEDPPKPIRWVGGIIRPYGFRHHGKPLRLAVWITRCGTLVDVAIPEERGPALLRRMLDEQLFRAEPSERPSHVTVWPSVKAAFRDMSFPAVEVRKDMFLKMVVEDSCSYGQLPGGVPVRAG